MKKVIILITLVLNSIAPAVVTTTGNVTYGPGSNIYVANTADGSMTVNERHFYTMDETEINKLIDNYSRVWTYKGIAWYAYE